MQMRKYPNIAITSQFHKPSPQLNPVNTEKNHNVTVQTVALQKTLFKSQKGATAVVANHTCSGETEYSLGVCGSLSVWVGVFVPIVLSVHGAHKMAHLLRRVCIACATEGGWQRVTAVDNDGCTTFSMQLGQLDTLTRGTCFSLRTNLLKDNSNGRSHSTSKW